MSAVDWGFTTAARTSRGTVLGGAGGGDVRAGLPRPASVSCNYACDFCSGDSKEPSRPVGTTRAPHFEPVVSQL